LQFHSLAGHFFHRLGRAKQRPELFGGQVFLIRPNRLQESLQTLFQGR
jgi:hypothetical protein